MKEGEQIYKLFASTFLIFVPEPSYDLLKLSNNFTPFFHNKVPGQKLKILWQAFVPMSMMNKCAKFHGDIPSGVFISVFVFLSSLCIVNIGLT